MRTISENVRVRAEVSLALVAIALCLLVVSRYGWMTLVPEDTLMDVVTNLLLLALAGIWVSYAAERQSSHEMKLAFSRLSTGVTNSFSVLSAVQTAGVSEVFYSSRDCRGDTVYQRWVRSELEKARGEICILGVCAREYLRDQRGFAHNETKEALDRGVKLKLLLLHPLSEHAVTRGLAEQRVFGWSDYFKTNMWLESMLSCNEAVTLMKARDGTAQIETRLYRIAPYWSMLFANDCVLAEPYHLGAGGLASGKVPVIVAPKGSELYRQLHGHFDYVWHASGGHAVTKEAVESIDRKSRDPKALKGFEDHIRFARPDLFAR